MYYEFLKSKVENERRSLEMECASGAFSLKNHLDSHPMNGLWKQGKLLLPASHPLSILKAKKAIS